MRPLMEAAYESLTGGLTPIVVAPTGYGKTMASPEIYKNAVSTGIAGGLIHVVPLRSLVRRIYEGIFKHHGGGYQMHDPVPSPEKSPYYLRSLVVTTLDSYLWNLYRIPVMEASVIERRLSMGHYYPIYTSIYTSINVFDEAHLYMGYGEPGKILEAVEASIEMLAKAGAYVIIETATLRPSILHRVASTIKSAKGKPIVYTLSCYADELRRRLIDVEVRGVDDIEWVESNVIPWDTSITSSWDSVVKEAIEVSEKGPVLLVANTVDTAIQLYKTLEGKIPEDHLALIHGRLSEADRREVEDRIVDLEKGVIVATQVIEAGVDVNSIAVYTEAAPIENLVQRVGRACRRGRPLSLCRSEGARVVIVEAANPGVYDVGSVSETLAAIRRSLDQGIDWRIPCKASEATPYTTIIELLDSTGVYRGPPRMALKRASQTALVGRLFSEYLGHDGRPEGLLETLDELGLCSLFRDTSMVQVDTATGPVTVSLEWALSNPEVLERNGEGAPLIYVYQLDGDSMKPITSTPARRLWSMWAREVNRARKPRCRDLLKRLYEDLQEAPEGYNSRITWRFRAAPNAYEPGIGLLSSSHYKPGG